MCGLVTQHPVCDELWALYKICSYSLHVFARVLWGINSILYVMYDLIIRPAINTILYIMYDLIYVCNDHTSSEHDASAASIAVSLWPPGFELFFRELFILYIYIERERETWAYEVVCGGLKIFFLSLSLACLRSFKIRISEAPSLKAEVVQTHPAWNHRLPLFHTGRTGSGTGADTGSRHVDSTRSRHVTCRTDMRSPWWLPSIRPRRSQAQGALMQMQHKIRI